MKLDKGEYHLTTLQEEMLKTTYRMWRVLPFVKKEGEKTIYWDLLKSLFDRYHLLKSLKSKVFVENTPIYNTTLDYVVEKQGNLSSRPSCSLINIKKHVSSVQL